MKISFPTKSTPGASVVAQVVEHLPSKCVTMSSNPSTAKIKLLHKLERATIIAPVLKSMKLIRNMERSMAPPKRTQGFSRNRSHFKENL
jgi:hypothetical protein